MLSSEREVKYQKIRLCKGHRKGLMKLYEAFEDDVYTTQIAQGGPYNHAYVVLYDKHNRIIGQWHISTRGKVTELNRDIELARNF